MKYLGRQFFSWELFFQHKIFEDCQACPPVPRFSAGGWGITPQGPLSLSIDLCGMQPSWASSSVVAVDLGWVEAQQSPRGAFHHHIPRTQCATDSEDNDHQSVWRRKQFRCHNPWSNPDSWLGRQKYCLHCYNGWVIFRCDQYKSIYIYILWITYFGL